MKKAMLLLLLLLPCTNAFLWNLFGCNVCVGGGYGGGYGAQMPAYGAQMPSYGGYGNLPGADWAHSYFVPSAPQTLTPIGSAQLVAGQASYQPISSYPSYQPSVPSYQPQPSYQPAVSSYQPLPSYQPTGGAYAQPVSAEPSISYGQPATKIIKIIQPAPKIIVHRVAAPVVESTFNQPALPAQSVSQEVMPPSPPAFEEQVQPAAPVARENYPQPSAPVSVSQPEVTAIANPKEAGYRKH